MTRTENTGATTPIDVEYLVATPGRGEIRNQAQLSFAGDLVGEIKSSSTAVRNGLLAMPALVDAHDHVRGLHHLAFGARDQTFEIWRAALYAQPPLDLYMNCALAFGRLAQAGVGSVMHVYSPIKVDRLAEDAEIISRAARDVGIRLAFAVPLRDQMTLGYGED